ncbi:MAG: SPASM domain-containing protein, partial [Candidatus Sumerlaeota bacterium]
SSYGNLNTKSFEEIWNGERILKTRTDFLANHIPLGCQGKHCRVDLEHHGTMEKSALHNV